jgi:hypothetical protein
MGRFQFEDVARGRYTLTATRSGHVTLSYGQRRISDSGSAIDVAASQIIDGVDFSLPRAGVILVRLTDDLGEPLAGARVGAQMPRFQSGVRTLGPVRGLTSANVLATTDDRGEARLYGLPAGAYYVVATPRSPAPTTESVVQIGGRSVTYVPTYAPGTSSVQSAQQIKVAGGQTSSIELRMALSALGRVDGLISSSTGPWHPGSVVELRDAAAPNAPGRIVTPRPDGGFTIPNVTAGEYELLVGPRATRSSDPAGEFAFVRLTIGEGETVSGLTITTTPGGVIRGRVTFDGGMAPPSLQPGVLFLTTEFVDRRANKWLGIPKWNQDWTFEIPAIAGDAVLRLRSGVESGGWGLRAVMHKGRDVTDTPFTFKATREIEEVEVALTSRLSGIRGSAVDQRGTPTREYAAVVFPEDETQWNALSRFIAAGRPDQNGGFVIRGLPAGRYLAAAVDELEDGEEWDPALLKQLLVGATSVSLGEGEAKSVTLRLR